MSVERRNRQPYRTVIDRIVVTGEELMKEWRGALRKVNLPGVPNAFIVISSSLHRAAFRGYEVESYVTKPGNLTDKEQGDLAKQTSDNAYSRMLRARKGDFS